MTTHTNDVVNQILLLNGISSSDINAFRIMCITDNIVSFIIIKFLIGVLVFSII